MTVNVFDVTGRLVATLVQGYLSAGQHEVQWRADNMPSGVYLVRMQAGAFSQTKRMTLVK